MNQNKINKFESLVTRRIWVCVSEYEELELENLSVYRVP